MPLGTKFEDDLSQALKNPDEAAHYVLAAIEENDPDFLVVALRDVVKAWGVNRVSRSSKLTRQAVHKILNGGNPTLSSIHAILDSVGLELSVRPKKKKRSA
jgi:probable addiction module antidote protein